MFSFFLGLVIGCVIGVVSMCVVQINKKDEKQEKERQLHKGDNFYAD